MKERLTGAIILVAVLVLLVPELLSGPGEGFSARPESAGSSVPLRSYTIDLADDASRRATAPTSAPTLATDEPVAMAVPEPDGAGSDEGTSVLPGAGGADARAGGSGSAVADGSAEDRDRVAGSGADRAAAVPPNAGQNAARSVTEGSTKVEGNAAAGARPPSVEDDQPRSAFGPNAVQRPKPAPSESPKPQSTAPAARAASSGSGSGRAGSSESPRPAASDAKLTKGWAVQLGVFASSDNAERLAKQVKGKGYTVSVNETSGNGKRLYRVRVGPVASQPAAAELGAKLRASGHSGGRVVAWP